MFVKKEKPENYTFLLYDDPERGFGGCEGFEIVVIVVDGEEVPLGVGVAHEERRLVQIVHAPQECIEVFKRGHLVGVDREAPELRVQLSKVIEK